jgi:hypothetical protein
LTREHANEFEHLDVALGGVKRNYDLGWKFDSNTNGPVSWKGDPFLQLFISFWMTEGETRRSGTLHYAMTRDRWHDVKAPTKEDRDDLLGLAKARLAQDLAAIEAGADPAWVEEGKPLFLP